MWPDRVSNSGGYTAVRSVMHLGMIPKWRKHKKNIRSNKLRPVIKCACSTGPQNVHAMCPDRNPNSGDDTAARWVMHPGMIPELRKHQHYMRRTTCRHVIKCAYFTAPQNVHVKCPDRILNSGGYIAVRSVMHLGMMPKWKKQKNYIRSIKLRPLIKCACSTVPHKMYKQCNLTEFEIRVITQPQGEWCTLVWSANGEITYILHEPFTWGLFPSVLAPQYHTIYKQCALTEFSIQVDTQPSGQWCT
jgi:hypothetical protein